MYNLEQNIYSNFEWKNDSKYRYRYYKKYDPTKKVRALIMGHCGSGKTHFINKMCNANLPMGVTGSSYTRDIDYLSCAYFP